MNLSVATHRQKEKSLEGKRCAMYAAKRLRQIQNFEGGPFIGFDLFLQQHDGIDQLLGAWRTSRDVYIDGDYLIHRDECVVAEYSRRSSAGTHGDHPLGFGHLFIEPPDYRSHLVRNAPGDDHQIRLARRSPHDLRAEARNVEARSDHRHHLDGATGETERHRPDGILPPPIDGFADCGSDNAFRNAGGILIIDAREKLAGKTRLKLGLTIHDPIITCWTKKTAPLRTPLTPRLTAIHPMRWRSSRRPALGASKPITGISGASSIRRRRNWRRRFWARSA